MAKQTFVPKTEQLKADWFSNFALKISGYSMKYNLSLTEVADVIASQLYFDYWFESLKKYDQFELKLTAFKNEVRDGVPAGAEPSVMPTLPILSMPPMATAPGGYVRAIALANSIKAKSTYTLADGQDLNLEGAEIVVPPTSTFKPVIKVETGNNGKPELKWKKQAGSSGIHFFIQTGVRATMPTPDLPASLIPAPATGGFIYLGSDTQPSFTDNTPLPAAGVSQLRKYVAIYFTDEGNVGQYSEEVKITVTGVI